MSMFKNAKTLNTAKPSSKKNEKPTEQMRGIKVIAIVDGLIKALDALKASYEGEVKATAFETFVTVGQKTHKRPENFRGEEEDASASIEMRKRGTASPLSDEEAEMLDSEGIAYETVDVAPLLYAINPKYASDEALMKRVEATLTKTLKAANVDADDFFVVQEKVTKRVVSDETIDAVFAAENVSREVVQTCTVLAIKPKLESFSVVSALKTVAELLK